MQKGERKFSINRKLTSIFPVRLVRGANDGGDKPESKPNARKMRFVKIRGDSRFIFFIGTKKPTSLGNSLRQAFDPVMKIEYIQETKTSGYACKPFVLACRPSRKLGLHKNETGGKSIILSPAKTPRKS